MKTLAALLFVTFIAGSSEALALPRLGRDAAGLVERLDGETKTFELRRTSDAKLMPLTWNSRTRFIQGREFVPATKLREGARVSVIYRSPFFGSDFVTKVVIGAAPVIRGGAR